MFYRQHKVLISNLQKKIEDLEYTIYNQKYEISALEKEKMTNEWLLNKIDVWKKLLELGTTYYKTENGEEFKK